MQSACSQAGNDDRSSVNKEWIQFVEDHTNSALDPPVRSGDQKSEVRGYNNAMLGTLLMPVTYWTEWNVNPAKFVWSLP